MIPVGALVSGGDGCVADCGIAGVEDERSAPELPRVCLAAQAIKIMNVIGSTHVVTQIATPTAP